MSRALGATIGTSPQPEIGWHAIQYQDNHTVTHWFGLDPTPTVIQWHYDAFAVPPGVVRLAGSQACPNQAWAMGPHLAMQFHIEMDETKAREWAAEEDPLWAEARGKYDTVQDSDAIVAGLGPHLAQHQRTADHIYRTWLSSTPWAQKEPDHV
jgi:GMP synthase-like glutamine amidotransferase